MARIPIGEGFGLFASFTHSALRDGLIKHLKEENEWEDFGIFRDCYNNCMVARAFDGWKEAEVKRNFVDIDDMVDALKADFKRQWREGAMRGVKI